MREIVDVIGVAAVFGNVAAGDGDAIAEPDDLDVEPRGFNHLVVDEDFTGVRNSGADDFKVFVDEAGLDHEWPHFGEDFSIEAFAGYAQPALSLRVNVAEGEIGDSSGFIGEAVEDVEVVQSAFDSSEEAGVVHIPILRNECLRTN